MKVEYSDELREDMLRKGRRNIAIEIAQSEHSDFEVTEIFLRYVKDSLVPYLEKKHYRVIETDMGAVLLPPYRLEYQPTLRFYLKKTWIFRTLAVEGVKL